MPYNTTAIPPRKEPTGQTQLPLSRVKKIIAQDPDIAICSNNAAFVITLAAEMFVQHLTDEAHTQAKLERKPRRNIQYKDVGEHPRPHPTPFLNQTLLTPPANAVSHQDNLEFLEDVVPKTVPFKKIKAAARATQARLRGENPPDEKTAAAPVANGTSKSIVNGDLRARDDDPNEQLELEMRQAAGQSRDGDVAMTG
ncbi:Fc.00g087190.m01.CDS01 [Cosmosporella sp. VM-42]